MKLLRVFAITLAAALIAAPVLAAPIPLLSGPMDPSTQLANANQVIRQVSNNLSATAYVQSGSGTTAITVNGLRFIASTTGLTTAAGVTSATITVTNSSITAASQVFCNALGYGGTGNPMPVDIVPAAGSVTYAIQNTHASAALNATVPISCMVYN